MTIRFVSSSVLRHCLENTNSVVFACLVSRSIHNFFLLRIYLEEKLAFFAQREARACCGLDLRNAQHACCHWQLHFVCSLISPNNHVRQSLGRNLTRPTFFLNSLHLCERSLFSVKSAQETEKNVKLVPHIRNFIHNCIRSHTMQLQT